MSHEIGSLGLVERENATVLNAALYGVAGEVTKAFGEVLSDRTSTSSSFFAQNDGTLMALEYADAVPGPDHRLRTRQLDPRRGVPLGRRGRHRRRRRRHVDRPRRARRGSRASLPRPWTSAGSAPTSVCPTSSASPSAAARSSPAPPTSASGRAAVGRLPHRPRGLSRSAGPRSTLTDAAVVDGRAGRHRIDTPARPSAPQSCSSRPPARRRAGSSTPSTAFRLGSTTLPLVAVGGGAYRPARPPRRGPEVLRPHHGDVANAVGAAIAWVSGRRDAIAPAGEGRRKAIEEACEMASRRAVQAGGCPRRCRDRRGQRGPAVLPARAGSPHPGQGCRSSRLALSSLYRKQPEEP